ncbi:thiamine pyrophosphate-dependent dehydrogenase E1 component subunit alpha [Aurantimonas sp. MSK8Z-1]|uniref:thiamine pyrophosphate-dependent dehydrogenase E1 component subunit alpha n=1 Tax=Mangrovibrevibacter kandeliae TaxID=2968473 RepID=UPI0021197632|nr:thiamine pyrophosphate-dependent dehydrogenase E1 component subunit alpha [Aurantimonas sp. MSK8Z-1]MCW4117005.1 thiamine pyrophosphate-dependent dehydrogenase E1 component subunit alpha [Aurantimonas sp. MSK8Z-1]
MQQAKASPFNRVPEPATRSAMLQEMMRIRRVEEEIIRRYGEQEMRCPTHICIGQEAPPVGVSAHLRRSDLVFSAHRSHGHYLAKGASLNGMIAELYGRESGCALGKGGSQHLIDLEAGFMGSAPILASTISVAVGAAWAAKRRCDPTVTVVYFGDGATEEGAFHEALNFAGVNRLPIVFVCENNLYSVHTPLDVRQPPRSIHSLAAAHGMTGGFADGNDADAVWRLGEAAVDAARNGEGPWLLEFSTYRWREHCGPETDDRLGYRTLEEINDWATRCPLLTYEARLKEEGVVTAAQVEAMRTEIEAEVEEAFRLARAAAFPPAEALSQFVYPNPSEYSV